MIVSARDRRLLVAGGVVVGTLIVVARGIPALRSWESQKFDEAAATAADLAMARDARRALPALRESLAIRRARLASLDSTLLSGQSAAAAAANLTAAVEQFAVDAGVKVNALQIVADSALSGSVAHVRLRITGVADVQGLSAFLRMVEGGDTALVVRELVVAQPDAAGPSSRPEALRIELLIEGIGIIRRDTTT
jgi:hypothetical protein